MKIHRLDLKAFGPFTNLSLDLSAGQQGLHVIFGPNEAGKSTTLRALEYLLFGMPDRGTDDFLHPATNLRIGAVLKHSDGAYLELWRRKARKHALFQHDDRTPLEQTDLAKFLGPVDRTLFETMFGLSRDSLAEGGQAILKGGGQLGQVLFAASAGLANLRTVQDKLEEEIGELFKPRGVNQKVNKNLVKLQDLKNRMREIQLPSDTWAKAAEQLRHSLTRRDQLQVEVDALRAEEAKYGHFPDPSPLIEQVKSLDARLESLRTGLAPWTGTLEQAVALTLPDPATIDDFLQRLRDGDIQAQRYEQDVTRVSQSLAQVQAELAAIEAKEAVPSESELDRLRKLRDLGWQEIRRAWLEGEPIAIFTSEFLQEMGSADLAEAFEKAQREADAYADRLRRGADRVAQRAELVQRRDRLEKDRQAGEAKRDAAKTELESLRAQWHALWTPLGIRFKSQNEMRTWLQKHGQLLQESRRRDEIAERLKGMEAGPVGPSRPEADRKRDRDKIQSLSAEIRQLDQDIGRLKKEVGDMDGSARAAQAAEEAASVKAELEAQGQQYALLRIGSAVLKEAIERFRRKSEASVTNRASRLFGELTAGAFEGLSIDVDPSGEPILAGVRARDRQPVDVEHLSDGARDQLYLALRLASLEVYLTRHEPIPFVADDLLVNFDDQRAESAFRALSDLAKKTQVLFFTHHRHLVDLARKTLKGDQAFYHDLPGPEK